MACEKFIWCGRGVEGEFEPVPGQKAPLTQVISRIPKAPPKRTQSPQACPTPPQGFQIQFPAYQILGNNNAISGTADKRVIKQFWCQATVGPTMCRLCLHIRSCIRTTYPNCHGRHYLLVSTLLQQPRTGKNRSSPPSTE
jgi:hypothetical protein